MGKQDMVSAALDRAIENHCEFEAWTFEELAIDLATNDIDFQSEVITELTPMVRTWFMDSNVTFRMHD